MNTSLYFINEDIKKALEIEDSIARDLALDTCKLSMEAKVSELAMEIRDSETSIIGIDDEIKRLENLKNWHKNHAEMIKRYIMKSMEDNGLRKIEFNNFKISLGNTPPAVIIDDESLLPEEVIKIKEVKQIDKMLLKSMLRVRGVNGCHLETKSKLNIK